MTNKSHVDADVIARVAPEKIETLLPFAHLTEYLATKVKYISFVAGGTAAHRFDRRHPA